MMSVEISKLSLFLADNKLARGVLSQVQFLETVQSCAEGLQFSIKSLSFEPPGSEAAHYYRLAQNAYSQVKDLLEITKLVKLK